MEHKLDCEIIGDLLPSYLENLTSRTTNEAVEEHVKGCEECKNALEMLKQEVALPQKAGIGQLAFLKKIKVSKIIAAAVTVVFTLICVGLLYTSEFCCSGDRAELSLAITNIASGGGHSPRAYVLETKEVGKELVAFFKDERDPNVFGFARLTRGLNGKYRLMQVSYGTQYHSAVVDIRPVSIEKDYYTMVGGYNMDGVYAYGFEVRSAISEEKAVLTFEVKNGQFLELYSESDIMREITAQHPDLAERFAEEKFQVLWPSPSLLDENGNDVTQKYRVEGLPSWGSSTGLAEGFMLYVWIVIVLGLGFIITRYFLA